MFRGFGQKARAVRVQILGKSMDKLCFEHPVALAGRSAKGYPPTCSRAGSPWAVLSSGVSLTDFSFAFPFLF